MLEKRALRGPNLPTWDLSTASEEAPSSKPKKYCARSTDTVHTLAPVPSHLKNLGDLHPPQLGLKPGSRAGITR